ncbi:hypothetical protein KR044_000029, partial [Drosophila immigrans]
RRSAPPSSPTRTPTSTPPVTVTPGSCCSSTTPPGRATPCRSTASGVTCAQTASWPSPPVSTRTTPSWRRTVSSSTSSTVTPRSSARSRSATSTSTVSPWVTSEKRRSRTAPRC